MWHLSAGVFALLALFYSRCVLQSRSVWRWAGALAAIILLAVALVIDFMADARTRDIAITLAIIVLGTNFLGHLIRARINQMLLRAPGGLMRSASLWSKWASGLSVPTTRRGPARTRSTSATPTLSLPPTMP